MAETAGPSGGLYEAQLRRTAELVNRALGRTAPWDLVWQSRSGPPQVPWLEPDVCDHLRGLDAEAAVLVPIGFVSDHMEVVYDLDTEARQVAEERGLPMERASTVGTHPAFVRMVRELMDEPEPVPCALTCCPAPKRRPAQVPDQV
ncbi:ferrochelatase [Nonomuraea ferruginea]